MKRNINILLPAAFWIVISGVLASCHSDKDAIIKADLSTKAESEKDFAGVLYTVENGMVTLEGACPSGKSKDAVEKTTKGLYGVKQVVNHIVIAPVVIGTDELLKKRVD